MTCMQRGQQLLRFLGGAAPRTRTGKISLHPVKGDGDKCQVVASPLPNQFKFQRFE